MSETDPQSGRDAYRALHDTIDLVLLDLSMPDMDGRAVYSEIIRINAAAKVLIMSGFSEKEIEIRFAGRPMGALTKPFAAERLLEAVQEALSDTDQPESRQTFTLPSPNTLPICRVPANRVR